MMKPAAAALLVFLLAFARTDAAPAVAQVSPERPNIVYVVADDMAASDLGHMPKTRALFSGVAFSRAYVSLSGCCPSRTTALTGKYAHNHGVLSNEYPHGGFREARESGVESETIATVLGGAGYETALIGKYLNGYADEAAPPGWDYWHGSRTPAKGFAPPEDGQTRGLGKMAEAFVGAAPGPFFLWFSPPAPHTGTAPSAEHAGAFPDAKAPRTRSFDEEDVSDKPAFVRSKPRLSEAKKDEIDRRYRTRLRTLQDLDDAVAGIAGTLEESGKLGNTYLVFTSDNGFHLGQHRLPWAKGTAYEEDVRVPLLVLGPGVPEAERGELVLNTDVAPTFADLAGVEMPEADGRSLAPLLNPNPADDPPWRTAVLLEKYRSGSDEVRYRGVRTRDHLYVKHAGGEEELYDTNTDPAQMRSFGADGRLGRKLEGRVRALKSCSGDSCRSAED